MPNKVVEKIQITKQKEEKILCNYCMRTLSNGIRCMGICVADNDYWLNSYNTYSNHWQLFRQIHSKAGNLFNAHWKAITE